MKIAAVNYQPTAILLLTVELGIQSLNTCSPRPWYLYLQFLLLYHGTYLCTIQSSSTLEVASRLTLTPAFNLHSAILSVYANTS